MKYGRDAVRVIVSQHSDDLAVVWSARCVSAKAGHVALRHLARFDERIAAHQDGCVIAGNHGTHLLKEALVESGPVRVFAAAIVALESKDRKAFEDCVSMAEALPECVTGLTAALGWVETDRLSGIVKHLLSASSDVRRRLALAACRMHRVDPGTTALKRGTE
jgi:hypothetical protein